MGDERNARREPRPDTVCLEGNGSRPTHRGIGWAVTDTMFTLNSTEIHAVAYGFEPGAAQRLNPESRINRELSPSLRANMGDNQVAVACIGIDLYNQSLTGEVSKTLNSIRSDSDHVPCVIVTDSPVLVLNCQGGSKEEVTEDKTATLTAALYSSGNNRMVVSYERESDGSE